MPDNLTDFDGVYVMPGGEVEGWIPFEIRKNAEILITFNGIPPQNTFSLDEPLCYIKIENVFQSFNFHLFFEIFIIQKDIFF